MVAFSTVKPGDRLFQVARQKMGNTTMTRQVVYSVRVIEVHEDHAICSWNGNTPRRWRANEFTKLRRSKPVPKPSIFDRARAVMEAGDPA